MEEELTTLLASVAGGRRHWGRAPPDAVRPFVTLQLVGGPRDYTLRGPSGYVPARVQIDCYADTYTIARATARAVIAALSGYQGGTIQGIFIDSERDLPATDAGEVNHLFRRSIDAIIHFTEN